MKNISRAAVVTTVLATGTAPVAALADWTTTGQGNGAAEATYVMQATAPTVTGDAAGQAVSITWRPVTLANGTQVTGYRVLRHTADGQVGVACAVAAPASACEDGVSSAEVAYGVVALVGDHWEGAESPLTSYTYEPPADVDTTAPTTSIEVVPGTASGTVQVTLTATDAGSGVASLHYQVGAGEWVVVDGSTATFTADVAASPAVTYYAVDNAGNQESPTTRSFARPATPSGLAISTDTGTSATDLVTNVSRQTVTGHADPGSSVTVTVGEKASTAVADATGTFSLSVELQEGSNDLVAMATDALGVTSAPSDALVVVLDTVLPTATVTWPTGEISQDEYKTGCGVNYAVCGTASDTGSGVASVSVSVTSVKGALVTSGTTSWSSKTGKLKSGTYTVTLIVQDIAGNEQTYTSTFIIS